MIYFDHLKLVRRNLTEVKRFADYCRGMPIGYAEITFVHESDGRCCRMESVNETLIAIAGPAAEQRESRLVMVNLPEGM